MDEAGSRARINATMRPPDVKSIEAEIEEIKGRKEASIKAQDFEKAAALRDSEKEAKDKLESVLSEWRTRRDEQEVLVTDDDIRHVVAKWTGVPLSRMEQKDMDRLLRVADELKGKVIGQDEAVYAMGKALRRSRADLKDPKRPIGSFIFLGPTGVGKTHLAKTLAEYMFGDESALIQIDMSEYMDAHNVSRLVGAPPGYVGYEEGGQLSEKVRRRPYSVVLFDEIEKAHPDIWNLLLQILEDGVVTDSLGRKVDFRNTIIIMTSNVGADLVRKNMVMGFGVKTDEHSYDQMKDKMLGEAKRVFKPEFLNRLDDIIVFHSLTREDLTKIVDIEVSKVHNRLKAREITFRLTPEATAFLIEKGYDPAYGARPLRRAVERYLEDPMAEELLKGTIKNGDFVVVGEKDKALTFSVGADTPSAPATPSPS
jgi:ATP-dependent Clp protease ATP-binding subunit ClpC